MTPNLMRAIDFWVGIPLTFLLTVVYRIQRLFGLAGSPAGRPRNILFIQLAEMGTMVVAYPSLRKARELFPDATLHFLCFTQIRASVEMLEIIAPENIITIDARSVASLARDTLRLPVARSPPRHRHGDQPGSVRPIQQHAELSVGRAPARRLPPLQSGRALRGRFADPQGALQRACPCCAHLPRPRARARHTAGPGAARETAEGDGLPRGAEDHDRRASGRGHLAQAPCDQRRHRTRAQAGDSESQCERAVSHAPDAPRVVHRARAHTVGRSRGLRPDHGRRQRQAGRRNRSAGRSDRHVRWT